MGKATRAKQAKQEEKEQQVASLLLQHSRKKDAYFSDPLEVRLRAEIAPFFQHSFRENIRFTSRLKTQDPTKRLLELVRYHFCLYRVPRLFEKAWTLEHKVPSGAYIPARRDVNPDAEYRPWYITIALGGSLYKTHTKGFLTKQETHILLNCPHDSLSIREAVTYSVAKAICGNDGIALKIAKSKFSERLTSKNDYWHGCIRFFATQPDINNLTVRQLSDFTDFLMHLRNQDANASIFGHGYTIASLTKRMIAWHHQLAREKVLGDHKWEGHAIHNEVIKSKNEQGKPCWWYIRQILNSKDLAAEGTAQRHCVTAYRGRCSSGDVSIWTLRYNEVDDWNSASRKVTIELTNRGDIVQARGLANRSPRPEEKNIIGRWATSNGLNLVRC